MELKAIACDIDHTITDSRGLLCIQAVKLVRRVEASGVRVVLISSREYMTAGSLSSFMGACGVVAAEDGSVVGRYLDGQEPRLLGDPDRIAHGMELLSQLVKPQLKTIPWPGRICSQIMYRNPDFPLALANQILKERNTGVRLLDSGVAYLLIDERTGKGRGLCEAAQILGLKPENFMAIGDNFNDLDMFMAAGWSVAVGNAPQAVKDQVNYVSQAFYGDGFCEGVLNALSRFKQEWRS